MSEPEDIQLISIEDELQQSYLDYAMSVIVGRALPDIRDGLKPVHRRVLYAMSELNVYFSRPYVKSARIVGEVIGKYHPHGDSAVYDTVARLAQDFSMRYMLIDGQGNFGSVDGDRPAAMRYTEVRLQSIAESVLVDLDKETVDFVPNYDDTLQMPSVLPTRVPNLLVNGSSGIAVGMATNIPPHNLSEVMGACLHLLEQPDATVDDLMEFIKGPDFPTAGIINGRSGIVQAYRTGRGRIYVRAKAQIEEDAKSSKDSIIITEIPYQLNKSNLMQKIAELVKEQRIEGIAELRDESDKEGIRIVIELKRGVMGSVVLNNLYTQTQLQSVYGINCVALVNGQPCVLNLKQVLDAFIQHRREVVVRRTLYLLKKAREKGHLLEAQVVALSNIDEVIELIKSSKNPEEALERLLGKAWVSETVEKLLERVEGQSCKPHGLPASIGLVDGKYRMSEMQARGILNMRLHRLTALEHEQLIENYTEVLDEIQELSHILASPERLKEVIAEELKEVNDKHGDERRTEILVSQEDFSTEDLVPEEEMVVTISHAGYVKTQTLDTYQAQRRGGRGKAATSVKSEDFVAHLLVASSHDTLLCFSNAGKVYWLKVYRIPQGSRTSSGRSIRNLLPLEDDERITTFMSVRNFDKDHFVIMATANGTVKKTPLEQFSRPRSNGLIAVDLRDEDTLIGVSITDGKKDVVLVASNGKVVRMDENHIRSVGRTATGVRGIRLSEGQSVIALIIPKEGHDILFGSRNGYGKRTPIDQFVVKGRGIQGVIGQKITERNGEIVGAVQVTDGDEVMMISDLGTLVRIPVDEVSVIGRNTQGVCLIGLRKGENLVSIASTIQEQVEKREIALDDQDADVQSQEAGEVSERQDDESEQ